MLEHGVTWNTVIDYALMRNWKAECMVGTMKQSVANMVCNGLCDWEETLRTAVYGYRIGA